MTSFSKRLALVNTLGTLGYISVLFQWTWSVLILASPLLTSEKFFSQFLCMQQTPSKPARPIELGAFAPIATIVAVIITIAIIVITIIMLARLPKNIGRGGAKITHKAATKTATFIHPKHTVDAKKERRKLSYRFVLLFKSLAIALPLLVLVIFPITALDSRIVWTIAWFCAICSFVYFTIQQILARIMRVKADAIW